jgi:hypothetical protein
MALHDSDIADLARQAVDRKDPTLDIRIDPFAQNDPYRFGTEAWTVTAGARMSYVSSSMTWGEALNKLITDLVS